MSTPASTAYSYRLVARGAGSTIEAAASTTTDVPITSAEGVPLAAAGALDTRFGTAGRFELPLVTNWNEAHAVVRQSDGKLILGGWVYSGAGSSGDFAAVRLDEHGVVDASFGAAGVVITATAPGTKNDLSKALVLQADERVPTVRAIQAGESNDSNHDLSLVRLWL